MGIISKLPRIPKERTGWPWTIETSEDIYGNEIDWPKVSIVTPSYNQGKYIEETIRSVLLQNYPNIELIVIDGGSTDETLEIIKKYEPWITYWISEPDNGQSHAINKGLTKCTGSIFNWLNSDDWYTPYALFEVAEYFAKDKSLKVVSGYENHVFPDGSQTIYNGTIIKKRIEQTLEKCHISQPSTFFKLRCINQIGSISEDLHYLMDAEMWMRFLVLHGQKHFLKTQVPIVNFRFHDYSKTFNHRDNKFIEERNSIINSLLIEVELPLFIRKYLFVNIFKASEVKEINIAWNFKSGVISKKRLKMYFIKRYINSQFQNRNLKDAYKGIKELLILSPFDFFVFKSIIKLVVK